MWRRLNDARITAVTVHRHPPLRTVAEARALRGPIPGTHVKNLLLRDRRRRLWLLCVPEDRPLDLRALTRSLEASGSLSFARADLVTEALGVEPGALTPLAVLNDAPGRVRLVMDRELLTAEHVCVHPLHNRATLGLSGADLHRFAVACGHRPLVLDPPAPVPPTPAP